MLKIRQARRHPVIPHRDCPLDVIDFERLERTGLKARLMDVSNTGAGIRAPDRIDQGFVWFHELVNGHRSGILVWCKQSGEHYRAGIRFIPLSPEHEEYIREQIASSPLDLPLRDPEAVIRKLIRSLTTGAEGTA